MTMRRFVSGRFAVSVFAACMFAIPALAAEKCPISDDAAAKAGGFANAVTAAVKAEFSCEGAYRMLDLCQLGSTADNALADMVLTKCEPRFLPKALPATKAAYEKARAKCSKIAAKDGTMYQGQAAVCLARTGRDFARKFGTKG
jgi:transposase